MATTLELTGMDEATAARACQAAHTELVKHLMAVVDLVDVIQRDGARLDVAKLRSDLGPQMRSSAVDHATALAALVLMPAPEYADELLTYAESIEVS